MIITKEYNMAMMKPKKMKDTKDAKKSKDMKAKKAEIKIKIKGPADKVSNALDKMSKRK